ncbi:hypothetical protein Hanom_Chr14g01328131 [Helianthus anomalus]
MHAPFLDVNGGQMFSGPEHLNNGGNIHYFKSAENNKPKKKVRIRPRQAKSYSGGNKSPILGERPRKRIREKDDFPFDLKFQVIENPSDKIQDEACNKQQEIADQSRSSASVGGPNYSFLDNSNEESEEEDDQALSDSEVVCDSVPDQIEEEVASQRFDLRRRN